MSIRKMRENISIVERHRVAGFIILLLLSLPLYADLAEPPLVECKHVMYLQGSTRLKLKMPSDVTVDENGRIYVVDVGNHQIQVFGHEGDYRFSFAKPGSGPGELKYPVGITSDGNGHIFVADRGNKIVLIFDGNGKYLKSIKAVAHGSAYSPVDVAVSGNENRLYVSASSPLHQVVVYDKTGQYISVLGRPGDNKGEFRFPASVAVGGEEDELYVVDVLNTRVQVIDKSGSFLVTVGSWGVTPGQLFRPKGVALTKDGNIYVSDSYMGIVQVYDRDTRFKGVLGANDKMARFRTPTGMSVDDTGRLYVTEPMADRVSVCQLKK